MKKKENIDIDELKKFSSKANQWWQLDGDFKTLHHINSIRLQFIIRQLPLKDKHVLDIGCGGGILSEAIAKQEAKVTAIDASNENISIAAKHAADNKLNIDYVVTTAETFSKHNDEKFDLITCMELLEHVPDPAAIIQACSNMVKPGGHVVFSTINRNLKAYMLAILAGEYLLKLLPKGTHRYERFIRPSELVNWCHEQALYLNDLAGIHYNPLLNLRLLTKQTDVNYLIDTIKRL